jgi:hypothetical protein
MAQSQPRRVKARSMEATKPQVLVFDEHEPTVWEVSRVLKTSKVSGFPCITFEGLAQRVVLASRFTSSSHSVQTGGLVRQRIGSFVPRGAVMAPNPLPHDLVRLRGSI